MTFEQRACRIRGSWVGAALAIALIAAAGPAWGEQAPGEPDAPGSLEGARALLRARAFDQAVATLRQLVSADPHNRANRELLAFALESSGDLAGEAEVRSALAADYPDDARIQGDLGRVLERSGDESGALRAYLRARALSAGGSTAEFDQAVERIRGRTAVELGSPLFAVLHDPDATASRLQAGVALPLASGQHVVVLGTHHAVDGAATLHATATSEELALTYVHRHGSGASWTAGPRLQVMSRRSAAPEEPQSDVGVGGSFAMLAPLGPTLEVACTVEDNVPWDESALTVLHGGRSSAVEGHVYSRWFARRLILQAGARGRRLSILGIGPASPHRLEVGQDLRVLGADIVAWSKPGAAVRAEMRDESLVARTTLSSSVTLAYRHYDLTTRSTPEFNAIIGLAPRGVVDEASVGASFAAPGGDLGLELRAGLARDSARAADMWRAGGTLIWAPAPNYRFALGYEENDELAGGLLGQRREGWVSLHVHV